jgi:hypothetical protein
MLKTICKNDFQNTRQHFCLTKHFCPRILAGGSRFIDGSFFCRLFSNVQDANGVGSA